MNMEKESEPSITDVFAGQILKNHGVLLDVIKDDKEDKCKSLSNESKKTQFPVIDPSTISNSTEENNDGESSQPVEIVESNQQTTSDPRENQLKEINEIEAKIQGLRQKLAEQIDTLSDDEDFLNIRTEAEELMNDFADDVLQVYLP